MDQYMTVKDTKGTAFYRVPKFLFTDVKYSKISTDAKILYGLLLDRMSLSEKNGWTVQYGEVYQFFTVDQAHKVLNFGHEKICIPFRKYLNIGSLTERMRQGQHYLLKHASRVRSTQKSGKPKEIRIIPGQSVPGIRKNRKK